MKASISHWFKVGLLAIGIVIVFSFVSIAQAEVKVKEYMAMKGREKEAITFYIAGVGVGTVCANMELRDRGKPPLYCPPRKLTLTADNYSRILDDEIERAMKNVGLQKIQDFPTEIILLNGLINTFPCNQK